MSFNYNYFLKSFSFLKSVNTLLFSVSFFSLNKSAFFIKRMNLLLLYYINIFKLKKLKFSFFSLCTLFKEVSPKSSSFLLFFYIYISFKKLFLYNKVNFLKKNTSFFLKNNNNLFLLYKFHLLGSYSFISTLYNHLTYIPLRSTIKKIKSFYK